MLRFSPFRLLCTVCLGLAASLLYGLVSMVVVRAVEGPTAATLFWIDYALSFNTLISFGLALGTAFIIFDSQEVVPATIGGAFDAGLLSKTDYFRQRTRFLSLRRSITFSGVFTAAGFYVFQQCQFPRGGLSEALMLLSGSAQWGLGVYVGRKLFYAAMMMRSLLAVPVTENLFATRKLDEINSYVHFTSTLTIICSYLHVRGYFKGPFLYHGDFGEGAKIAFILMAIIATPVLVALNVYARVVLNKLYGDSIKLESDALREALANDELSSFEKRYYLMEYDKMVKDELNNSLKLTLSDIPLGITLLIMVLEPFIK